LERAVQALFLLLVGCGNSDLLQGDTYSPNNELPIAPATDRPEGGTTRDGGISDAEALPIGDASTAPSNTCETARDIGKISGDQSNGVLDTSGTCSEWLSFRATEDSNSTRGTPMKVTITVTPKGGDFDLYVYLDAIRDARSCSAPYSSSFLAGPQVETIALTWGEGSVANADDDTRTVGIAVIRTGGPCGTGSYDLHVEGNK
jgi:hypothetical protein